MTEDALMSLRVLLPHKVFAERDAVTRIVVRTTAGSLGILPRRLDCTAAVVPGLFVYETQGEGETCIAVDEGILVKAGRDVLLSVRHAIGGVDLGSLREAVENEFLQLNEQQRDLRQTLTKMETQLVRRFMEYRHA